jgi:hypothetical protein
LKAGARRLEDLLAPFFPAFVSNSGHGDSVP